MLNIPNFQFDKIIAERKDKIILKKGDCIIKLFDESFSKSNVLNEALNQSRVEETGLNIPKIREVTVIDGKWAIVMDYVNGKTLDKLMLENTEKLDEFMQLFVDIQLDIHSRKHMLLTKFSDKMTLKIMHSELDASTRYDLAVRLSDLPKYNSVCHGDFNPSNVVITDNGQPFILDWSHASQGNPTADATKTYLIFLLSGDKQKADDYINLFCKKTHTPHSDVKKWIPLVAAAQLLKSPTETKAKLFDLINEKEE